MSEPQLDQFFTKPAEARKCWDWLHRNVDVPQDALYVEPSAGAGGFYDLMPKDRRMGFELDEAFAKKTGVEQADFLSFNPLTSPLPDKPLVFVGNPPFGFRGRLAIEFVNKAFELGAVIVAFILPPALRPYKDGAPPVAEKRIVGGYSEAFFQDMEPEYDLPEGDEKRIPNCAFVVYRKGERKREKGEHEEDGWRDLLEIKSVYYRPNARGVAGIPGNHSGMQHIKKCSLFIPLDFYEKDGYAVKTWEEVPELKDGSKSSLAVVAKKGGEEIVRRLLEVNWKEEARSSCAGQSHVTKREVEAVIDRLVSSKVDDFVSVHTVRTYLSKTGKCAPTGMQHMHDCDIYLPNSLNEGKRKEMKPYEDFCMGAMFGIKIKKERRDLLDWIWSFDWLSVARQSTNGNVSLGVGTIKNAIQEHYIDKGRAHFTLYSIGHANKKSGRCEWGQDKVAVCDLFLPNSRRHGQAIVPSKTKDFDIVIGMKFHKDKERLEKFVKVHDWASAANKSSNRNLCLNLEIVRRELEEAGFREALRPTEPIAQPVASLYYIVLVGKYRKREDKIDLCDLFLPACNYKGKPIQATDKMQGTRCIGIQLHDCQRRQEFKDWVLEHDWAAATRESTSGLCHLGLRLVQREVRAAGFIVE